VRIDRVGNPRPAAEYWIGLQNFYALTRYNRSSFYAVAVIELARALAPATPEPPTRYTPPTLNPTTCRP